MKFLSNVHPDVKLSILAVKRWRELQLAVKVRYHLGSCKQTKVRLPNLRVGVLPFVRRLNHNNLGRLIHFITGHNHLGRLKQMLEGGGGDQTYSPCGVGREDATHLWAVCSSTHGMVGGSPTWSPSQLSRFHREPLMAGLLDQVGT